MYLKIDKDIENNVFSSTITVDSLGTEQLSEDEEKELLANFPTKLAYRNLTFSANVKMNGSAIEVTDEEASPTGEEAGTATVVTVTLPALSNKEILVDEAFKAYYCYDYTKVSPSAINDVLTTKELVAQAYCVVFTDVICKEVARLMALVRAKAPAFEGEEIVSV